MSSKGFLTLEALLGLGIASGVLVFAGTAAGQAMQTVQVLEHMQKLLWQSESVLHAKQMHQTSEIVAGSSLRTFALSPCASLLSAGSSTDMGGRVVRTEASGVVTQQSEVGYLGNDCPAVVFTALWNHIATKSALVLGARVVAHGVDVFRRQGKVVAVVVTTSTQLADPDLFVVDVTNAQAPVLLAQLNLGAGFFAVDVYNNFAFLAQDSNSLQFQVVDITSLEAPHWVTSVTLPGVTGSFPEARGVFANDNKVYVSTYETAGPELHVVDVTNPATPVVRASVAVNHSIRAATVVHVELGGAVKQYLYVATSADAKELMVYDVTSASQPTFVISVDLAGTGNATAFALAGEVLFVGRQQVTGFPTVSVVSVADPAAPTVLSQTVPLLKSGAVVNGMAFGNGQLLFSATDTTRPVTVCWFETIALSGCSSATGFPSPGELDAQEGLAYVASNHSLVTVGE